MNGLKGITSGNELNTTGDSQGSEALHRHGCLSDVDENENLSSVTGSNGAASKQEIDEYNRFHILRNVGEFSLPNSPMHHPQIINSFNSSNQLVNFLYF